MNKMRSKTDIRPRDKRRNERGYALAGMMGVMIFGLILLTAAAPSIKFETQREREEEMLWRGQQVATAIAKYSQMRGGQYPTDLAQLVEGVEVGLKKIRLLRPSALCDPMVPCTPGASNWRPVYPGDPLVRELLEAYIATQQRSNMVLPQPPANLVLFAQMAGGKLPGQAADTKLDGNIGPPPPQPGTEPGGGLPPELPATDPDEEGKGPIIGVVSRKSDRMFRNYFGIEYYDHTLFFPGVPVLAGGFVNPLILGPAIGNSGPSPCPRGGVLINGKCWGGLTPGQQCRGADGTIIPCPPE